MDKIRILLCCGAGMSSGFLAQQMRIAAKKMNVVAKIEAKNKNSVQDERAAINEIDVQRVPGRFPWQAILQIEPKEKMQKWAKCYNFALLASFLRTI